MIPGSTLASTRRGNDVAIPSPTTHPRRRLLLMVMTWFFLCLFPLLSTLRKATMNREMMTFMGGNDMLDHNNNPTTASMTVHGMTQMTRTTTPIGDHNKTQQQTSRHSYLDHYLGAHFANGSLGYVADPTALTRGRVYYDQQLLQLQQESKQKQEENDKFATDPNFWNILQEYQVQARNGTETESWLLGPEYVCAFGPGRGLEEDGGYKLLIEKIRIHPSQPQPHGFRNPNHSKRNQTSPSSSWNSRHHPVRIFCAIYTYPRMRDLFRIQALTWGYKCDGFLAFSTETIPELGLVHLVHQGPESYQNMWQKVRSIWTYIYHHYGQDYDYFHLGGDDLYVMVENFRVFLQEIHEREEMTMSSSRRKPIFLGQRIPLSPPKHNSQFRSTTEYYYVAGAPGYTLNQRALQLLVEQAIPTCHVNVQASYEDRLISKCMRDLDIMGYDTRHRETGEEQYHDCAPQHLYTSVATNDGGSVSRGSFHSKLLTYWQTLPHPKYPNRTTGPKYGLEAAAMYSVNFHNLYHPLYVTRIHAILYPQTCPFNSPLGRGLQLHSHHDMAP